MEQEVKERFEFTDKEMKEQCAYMDKRFDDFKFFSTVVSTLFTLIFAVLTIVVAWNLQSEKAHLMDVEKDIRDEVMSVLGKLEEPPKMALYTVEQKPLSGRSIIASFDNTPEGRVKMTLRCILRNEGASSSGPVYIKLYTSDPLKLPNVSTDEQDFKYETYIAPKDLSPGELPGAMSVDMFIYFYLQDETVPPKGTYPANLKLFYGKGKVAAATFDIIVQ